MVLLVAGTQAATPMERLMKRIASAEDSMRGVSVRRRLPTFTHVWRPHTDHYDRSKTGFIDQDGLIHWGKVKPDAVEQIKPRKRRPKTAMEEAFELSETTGKDYHNYVVKDAAKIDEIHIKAGDGSTYTEYGRAGSPRSGQTPNQWATSHNKAHSGPARSSGGKRRKTPVWKGG